MGVDGVGSVGGRGGVGHPRCSHPQGPTHARLRRETGDALTVAPWQGNSHRRGISSSGRTRKPSASSKRRARPSRSPPDDAAPPMVKSVGSARRGGPDDGRPVEGRRRDRRRLARAEARSAGHCWVQSVRAWKNTHIVRWRSSTMTRRWWCRRMRLCWWESMPLPRRCRPSRSPSTRRRDEGWTPGPRMRGRTSPVLRVPGVEQRGEWKCRHGKRCGSGWRVSRSADPDVTVRRVVVRRPAGSSAGRVRGERTARGGRQPRPRWVRRHAAGFGQQRSRACDQNRQRSSPRRRVSMTDIEQMFDIMIWNGLA